MNNEFNPDDFEPIPEELLATQEEQLMVYADDEEVLDTTSRFLNIEGAEFGAQVYNALKEGEIDPIRTLLMLKKMQHVYDYFLGSDKTRTNKEAKQFLRDEISNTIGKETYRAYGATINIQAVGGATSIDYSECGDLLLNRFYEINNKLKELIKERHEFIKTNLPSESNTTLGIRTLKQTMTKFPSLEFVDIKPQEYNIIPPVKYGKDGIVVRFVKKKK